MDLSLQLQILALQQAQQANALQQQQQNMQAAYVQSLLNELVQQKQRSALANSSIPPSYRAQGSTNFSTIPAAVPPPAPPAYPKQRTAPVPLNPYAQRFWGTGAVQANNRSHLPPSPPRSVTSNASTACDIVDLLPDNIDEVFA